MTPEHIKETAIQMAKANGLENLSRNTLCAKAGIPAGSFTHIMGKPFKAFIRELASEGHGSTEDVTVTKRRIDPTLRRAHIISAAVRLAEQSHYLRITRADVAEAAGVYPGTVSKYFSTMSQLRRAVMRAAKEQGNETVLAQNDKGVK